MRCDLAANAEHVRPEKVALSILQKKNTDFETMAFISFQNKVLGNNSGTCVTNSHSSTLLQQVKHNVAGVTCAHVQLVQNARSKAAFYDITNEFYSHQ